MSVEDIRERDRLAVARVGDPQTDPRLRAEMDRRILLRRIDDLEKEIALLERTIEAHRSSRLVTDGVRYD